jgi:hypothetical protein
MKEWAEGEGVLPWVEIPLTKGFVARIDAEDFDRVSAFKWRVTIRKTVIYAGRGWREGSKQHHEYLHRFILQAPRTAEVDHRNGNGLDCRKCNLRLVTHQGNAMNRGRFAKGYRYRNGRYEAYIAQNGQQYYLGTFHTEHAARNAREHAVIMYFGDMDARKEERDYERLG